MDEEQKRVMYSFIMVLVFLGIVWLLSLTVLEPSNDVNLTITYTKSDINLTNQDYVMACFQGCNDYFKDYIDKLNSCYSQCNIMYLGFNGDLK